MKTEKLNKMTPQEAIKELSYDNTAYGGKCTKEVREVAIRALEKQIPMKPLKAYDEQAEQHWLSCPMCYKGLCWEHGFKPKHCSECGQLMDWSEQNEKP